MQGKNLQSYITNMNDANAISDHGLITNDENSQSPTNVIETDSSYNIEIALQGYNRDEIKAFIDNDLLIVHASGHFKTTVSDKDFRQHYFTNYFSRSFILPEDVQEDNIEVLYRDGILLLILPKGESPVRCFKEIEIRS